MPSSPDIWASGYTTLEPPPPPAPAAQYRLGLDLGVLEDFTALAVIELDPNHRPGETGYTVRHLERWRLPYPRIVQELANIVRRPPLLGHHQLLVDSTGVGVAVYQMLLRAGLQAVGITITGGGEVGQTLTGLSVPKADLVSALSVVLQSRRLKVAPGLPSGKLLADELSQFVRKQNPVTGHNQFAVWREGAHDDLVLATALACWHGEHFAPIQWY
jgi:hypothetical protein